MFWGRSYPGFPIAVAGLAVLAALAALALTLLPYPRSRRTVALVAVVAVLPTPTSYRVGDEETFREFPGLCPPELGGFRLSGCSVIDGGYLFLQAPGALTDSSGIVYLPAGQSTTSTLGTAGLAPLGGPWWSWTCSC